MSLVNQTSFTEHNNIDDIYQDLVIINWENLQWDITSSPENARYFNINNNNLEMIPDRYLNAYAFSNDALNTLESNSIAYPIDLFIPSCCCKKCTALNGMTFINIILTPIHSLMSVKNVLDAINKEYSNRYITIDELCKNDSEPFIKNIMNYVNKNNSNIAFKSILNNRCFISSITHQRDGYYLYLRDVNE